MPTCENVCSSIVTEWVSLGTDQPAWGVGKATVLIFTRECWIYVFGQWLVFSRLFAKWPLTPWRGASWQSAETWQSTLVTTITLLGTRTVISLNLRPSEPVLHGGLTPKPEPDQSLPQCTTKQQEYLKTNKANKGQDMLNSVISMSVPRYVLTGMWVRLSPGTSLTCHT